MKRIHEIRIRLNADELKKVKFLAESMGLNISSFTRLLLLKSYEGSTISRHII